MDQYLLDNCASLASKDVEINSLTSFHTAESIKDVIKDLAVKRNLPLGGKLITVKENMCTKYWTTSASSEILSDYVSPFEATLVENLEKNGGVIIGKTNMDEFAMGTSTHNNLHGRTAFPQVKDELYQVGGSSGGCAASVAADLSFASIGTDTGGSVRLPAAYVGCVGFKPSFGRISRYGVIPFAHSMDTVGIVTKDVESTQTVYNVLNQPDSKDATCLSLQWRKTIDEHCKKFKSTEKAIVIGVPTNWNIAETHPEVLCKWNEFISLLKSQGCEIREIQLPNSLYGLSIYAALAYAEGVANLARFSNPIFGSQLQQGKYPDGLDPRTHLMGQEVQKRLLIGAYSLSFGKDNRINQKAQLMRRAVQMEFNRSFRIPSLQASDPSGDVDFIVTPSFLKPSQPIGASTPTDFLSDSMLVPSSLAGLPSISIPFGKVCGGLPMGMQLIAQYGDDESLLSFSKRFT
ncbi:glutamyl-tRNA amidotransferase [Schizosaccharomyces cryophilus OY26]|uniref:Glutamyl-tRNA amidotransferase n=1 Tax=Schizosaccharomyces cryophilus (strain OY26 / ATCC MYA-4695 / CBS 11777 / NBRC 106824 / NRRL Y48691) TaxID=653667 RepID=S9VXX7_SCHCR|nr:glutamyl-tRNA amidotransferase [Schizosaccharomyces cryophilus OY26]EPY51069.1 glutamyl-tRNA amidotransferase [Schizosaccharomyces cryophilus OY26]